MGCDCGANAAPGLFWFLAVFSGWLNPRLPLFEPFGFISVTH